MNISLEDGSGSKIKDRPVQLKCLLRYAESGMPVTNQNVLRIWTDSHDKAPVFVPAGHPASLLEDADFPAASKAFDREIENKSACVHDLDKFGSLDSLKEAAFLYCYSKEPWAELDFS